MSSLPTPTSVPGYRSAWAGPILPDHLRADYDPMDWQPEENIAVEAWKYQVALPLLLSSSGVPSTLPPLYTYHPLPINFEASATILHLHQIGGSPSQIFKVQLALAAWHEQQLTAAIQQDKWFLETRYWEEVRMQETSVEVVRILQWQQEQQRQQQQRQKQATDQQQLIKDRVAALKMKEVELFASSSSSSSSSPDSSSSPSSTQSDQGNAFRGMSEPSVLAASAPAPALTKLNLGDCVSAKFRNGLAGMIKGL